jgi:hypothetical protein
MKQGRHARQAGDDGIEQLADVRRVQSETKRIVSILYSERLGRNR